MNRSYLVALCVSTAASACAPEPCTSGCDWDAGPPPCLAEDVQTLRVEPGACAQMEVIGTEVPQPIGLPVRGTPFRVDVRGSRTATIGLSSECLGGDPPGNLPEIALWHHHYDDVDCANAESLRGPCRFDAFVPTTRSTSSPGTPASSSIISPARHTSSSASARRRS